MRCLRALARGAVSETMDPGHFIDADALERSLATAREGAAGRALTDALDRVMAATRQLFDATGCGIMMVNDDSALCAVAATDRPGWLLEERQQDTGEGPCVEALTFDRIVRSADLHSDERWPGLASELRDAGVRAVLGVPIELGGLPIGSLNVYRDRPSEWEESEVLALEAYAHLVESLLQTALQARERQELAQQLQHARPSRGHRARGWSAHGARQR